MKIKLLFSGLAIGVLFSLNGCRPRGAEYVSDLDIVGTAYSKTADFKSKSTYYISDTVQEVDADNSNKPVFISQSSAVLIVSQIDKNMQKYGWKKVTDPLKADLIMQTSVMKTTNVYYYYSYYGYYGYYGWYYPGYYPPTYTTTKSGTVLMLLINRTDVSVAGKAPVWWAGVINGMMEGSTSSINSRAVTSIDQAFTQSPILKK